MENNNSSKIKIGITHGDINGISYEIILKSFEDERITDFFTPVIYGSPKVAAYYKKMLQLNININSINKIEQANLNQINIINCATNNIKVEIGKSTKIAGQASLNALRHSLIDIKNHKLDILVTAPINKNNIQTDDFKFAGHTRFFASEFGGNEVVMLMVHENLRIGVATEHIAISEVSENITVEKILDKLRVIAKSLKTDFAINKPVIAVLGLNPHSGDNGLIGKEELEIIIPAIEKAKEEGIIAVGPYPADGFFGSNEYKKFDAILAMYHDQGMIPFKALTQNQGVNFTAGLPFVRTSPAHGTAYNIVGKNKSNHQSFMQAMYLALDVYKNRKMVDTKKMNIVSEQTENINIEKKAPQKKNVYIEKKAPQNKSIHIEKKDTQNKNVDIKKTETEENPSN